MTLRGVVKSLPEGKKFGFITDEDGDDRFFHQDGVVAPLEFSELAVGDEVEFEPDEHPKKGPRAEQVRRA